MGRAKSEDFEELKLEAESMDEEWSMGGAGMVPSPRLYQVPDSEVDDSSLIQCVAR